VTDDAALRPIVAEGLDGDAAACDNNKEYL
jgi:hypothetical protein